jgi:DNA (cytosine-5)-methyltransferase 1
MTLRMLDLFAGIGGFSYAGEKLVGGYETVAFCEYDKHCQKVLRKHWPDTEIIDDVRELANDADRFRGLVDIVVGGYPCQPFSLAGIRRGDKDDRHLWPEMLRIIKAVRPTWVIGENVAGHITLGLDTVLSDLEAAGYASRCFVIPAVSADALHRRDRCWIIAHADREGEPDGTVNEQRLERAETVGNAEDIRRDIRQDTKRKGAEDQQDKPKSGIRGEPIRSDKDVPNASGEGLQGDVGQGQARAQGQSQGYPAQSRWWQSEPAVGRVANGVPGRVHRLKQLGNSIVPQVAARILWAIKEAHNEQTSV